MANENTKQPGHVDMASWKPGSEPEKAREVSAAGDFGVPVAGGSEADRAYVSQNTRMSDPGNALPFAWEQDGVRDHGAGARNSGPGSGSGGDLDTDIIGFGKNGSGLAAKPPGDAPGRDDTDGKNDEFAAPLPGNGGSSAKVEPASGRHPMPGTPAQGSTVNRGGDVQSSADGEGADSATNAARNDDSFAGEISGGEARGEDLPMAPAGEEYSPDSGSSPDDFSADA